MKITVICLLCKTPFEVDGNSKIRICENCLEPQAIKARVNLLKKLNTAPFNVDNDE